MLKIYNYNLSNLQALYGLWLDVDQYEVTFKVKAIISWEIKEIRGHEIKFSEW